MNRTLSYDFKTGKMTGDFTEFFAGKCPYDIYAGYGAFARYLEAIEEEDAAGANEALDDLEDARLGVRRLGETAVLHWLEEEDK